MFEQKLHQQITESKDNGLTNQQIFDQLSNTNKNKWGLKMAIIETPNSEQIPKVKKIVLFNKVLFAILYFVTMVGAYLRYLENPQKLTSILISALLFSIIFIIFFLQKYKISIALAALILPNMFINNLNSSYADYLQIIILLLAICIVILQLKFSKIVTGSYIPNKSLIKG